MATNYILPWAQTSTANALSDTDYASAIAANGSYVDGVTTGQASSQQANKTWRQATAPGAGLGQFLVDNLSVDVTDADTPATFSARIANAVLALSQISPFNQSWATATGGYKKYAIVSDSSGNYWSSTADQNVTVPGASGANWQSLFNGYATESWSNAQFLQLALATLQSVTGPVAFAGKTTVPDVSAFTGADALNAETAEGRYIKSILVSPNKRITDIWENADGRLVFGDGTAAPIVANLSDLPMASPDLQVQSFTVTGSSAEAPITTTFPVAFKAGTIPNVWLQINPEPTGGKWARVATVVQTENTDGTFSQEIDNTGFTWGGTFIGGYGTSYAGGGDSLEPYILTVLAIGEKQ